LAHPYAILNELLRSNSEIVTFQKNKINELATKDFPFDSKDLIDVLKAINKEIAKIFENLQQTFQDYQSKYTNVVFITGANPYEDLLVDLLNHIQLVWIINALIHFMEQSSHENVSQSAVFLIDRLTKNFSEDSKFLLTPIFENNFTYRNIGKHISDLIRDALPNAKEILAKFPENFSILSFPAIHRDNIVSNILLAHEVGHFFINIKNLEQKIFSKIQIDVIKFRNYINNSVLGKKSQITEQETQTIIADNWGFLTQSIQSWIRELLSDAVGFRLTGPVFVFMLSETLLSLSHHSIMTRRHPPPSMRIKIILDQIEKRSFIKNLKNGNKKNIEELLEQITDYVNTPKLSQENFLLEFVFESVSGVIDEINKIVDDETKNFQYSTQEFATNVPILMKKLDEIIPPCEIENEKPADVISILNAGIIYKMTWMKENKYNIKTVEERENLEKTVNALVLKAIELSVLDSMMLKHKLE